MPGRGQSGGSENIVRLAESLLAASHEVVVGSGELSSPTHDSYCTLYAASAGTVYYCSIQVNNSGLLSIKTGSGISEVLAKGAATTKVEVLSNRLRAVEEFYSSGTYGKVVFLTSVSSPYTVTSQDYIMFCNCSGGRISILLPAAVTNVGRTLKIKKTETSANDVELDGNGVERVEDVGLYILAGGSRTSVEINCDGAGWWVVG